jgi:hypothetical protein
MIKHENFNVTGACLKCAKSSDLCYAVLARFYSRDFIFEMVSMRYINIVYF